MTKEKKISLTIGRREELRKVALALNVELQNGWIIIPRKQGTQYISHAIAEEFFAQELVEMTGNIHLKATQKALDYLGVTAPTKKEKKGGKT